METPSERAPNWGRVDGDAAVTFAKHAIAPSLVTLRESATKRYLETGLPSPALEEWRYTDLAELARLPLRPVAKAGIVGEAAIRELGGEALSRNRLVFVDGQYQASLSHIEEAAGLTVTTLGQHEKWEPATGREAALHAIGAVLPPAQNPISALNGTFASDGVVVAVAAGCVLREPIAILNLISSSAQNSRTSMRNVIVVGARAEASVVEYYSGPDVAQYLSNPITEIVVQEEAHLTHIKVQREGVASYHLGIVAAKVARAATFASHTFSFGSKLARNEIHAVVEGVNAHVTINGLTVLSATQHVDNQTVLDHAAPHCESSELFKGIYGGASAGVFSGTIIVRPDAQKTNAYQSNRSLLLSPEATISTRPQLKIWADDVKCTHGATIGQIDEAALFYLRSRGVGLKDARAMLIHAFASDLISTLKSVPLRAYLETQLMSKLERCHE